MISGGHHLTLGEESTLSCQVSDVYPAELLTLTWLRGDAVLQSTMGDPGSSSVRSRYQLLPEKQDSGALITCRATLDLQELPTEERIKESNITLNVLCESLKEVQVLESGDQIQEGGGLQARTRSSTLLGCVSSCALLC